MPMLLHCFIFSILMTTTFHIFFTNLFLLFNLFTLSHSQWNEAPEDLKPNLPHSRCSMNILEIERMDSQLFLCSFQKKEIVYLIEAWKGSFTRDVYIWKCCLIGSTWVIFCVLLFTYSLLNLSSVHSLPYSCLQKWSYLLAILVLKGC